MSVPFSGGFGGSSGGIDTGDIGHSLRFRGAQYLSKTLSTPTANTSWAFSIWVKRGTLTGEQCLFGAAGGSDIRINTANQIAFVKAGTPVANSSALYRDPPSHGHLFVRSNGTNIKGYWNGAEVLSYTGTIPHLNSAVAHTIGRYAQSAANWLDGHGSRLAFVDNGGALTPGDFIYLNTDINEWVTKSQSAVKAVVDAGGTNSFMLDFDDATSLTTLGYDKSSKGNNWTLNNFSLTAGPLYDLSEDVPGNSYCTINNIAGSTTGTASDGNLKLTTGTTHCRWFGTMAMSAGSWVWEGTCTTAIGNDIIGIIRTDQSPNGGDLGDAAFGYGYRQNGDKKNNAASSAYGASYTSGDVIRMEYNATAGSLVFFKNGTTQGVAYSGLTGEYYPAFGDTVNASGGTVWNLNFGQAPLNASATYHSAAGGYFRDAPTAGFKALCQANLPDVAIKNPKKHFDVLLHTGGASSAQDVTGTLFQPDFAWIKDRSAARSHGLFDSIRGATAYLASDLTSAEGVRNGQAFLSNGFRVDRQSGQETNTNGETYVDWLWKAGGAAVSNTAGSITSQVSANVDAGFSIVTYTGNYTAGATVGHGLGTAPKLVIAKNRDAAFDWPVFHLSAGATAAGLLNLTNSFGASAYFNSVAPTSSVVALGQNNLNNQNAAKCELLCFADIEGYSKVFSYTGNGSADGPYVHLGFKPRWVLVKRSSGTGSDWFIRDLARSPYNVVDDVLFPNLPDGELPNAVYEADITSTGFKVRNSWVNINGNGETYIGFAIADVAGKYSLGR